MHASTPPCSAGRGRRHPSAAIALAAGVLVAGLLSVAGCATQAPAEPQSMRDPQANFAAYRTFGWDAGGAVDAADAPLKLLDGSIRAAIAAELNRRGYVAAADGATPDLRIVYETTSAEKLENSPVRIGVGVGSWGSHVGGSVNVGSPSVRNYREGTLVVHAIDTARNAEVWQGRVSKKVTKGSTEPAAIAQAVGVAMKDFPAH
jgi:glucose dehydrogenase